MVSTVSLGFPKGFPRGGKFFGEFSALRLPSWKRTAIVEFGDVQFFDIPVHSRIQRCVGSGCLNTIIFPRSEKRDNDNNTPGVCVSRHGWCPCWFISRISRRPRSTNIYSRYLGARLNQNLKISPFLTTTAHPTRNWSNSRPQMWIAYPVKWSILRIHNPPNCVLNLLVLSLFTSEETNMYSADVLVEVSHHVRFLRPGRVQHASSKARRFDCEVTMVRNVGHPYWY